ncbi:NipSnap homolog 3A [Elysia marginata]|uniref:NipSnap homolog 3A n=1 Tax=Elysia marginata TaxID=1093978 RepID=A0AAV4FA31_9GAST|nr:NipSnap homolog 3A [Elysia marginata]
MYRSKLFKPISLAWASLQTQPQNLHGTRALSSSIYELRNYQAHPKNFKALVGLFNDHIDKRTKHSKLLGFWTVEVGDNLWQLVHLWEYGSLEERRRVRNALAQDEAWASEFLIEALPRMEVMRSQLVIPAPSTKLNLDFTNNSDGNEH